GKNVDFTIGRGETLGLVGESGSGKSTIGRIVAGLTRHDGTVSFTDVTGGPSVQMVFQNPDSSLNPRRTVRQILSRSIRLLSGTMRVEELAESVGIPPGLLPRYPGQLSGGQKQRVAMARACAGPVPLVVCDEPTSALDVSVQARVLDLLIELQERTEAAYLFISHDLAVVRRMSHRIGVMKQGEMVELQATCRIFEEPEHPYTRALVDAARKLRPRAQEPGAPPEPM
ncbi:MAG: ATP-binding cassette domain-containing protein, partial [Micrococcaceae bacterium]|nr:ATP-binding cassette domain-containing protein [Micrococcaceae bacterium]